VRALGPLCLFPIKIMDLFEQKKELESSPLAFRMRPTTLDEFIGQEHIIGEGTLLRKAIENDRLSSIILYGPPGTGKTTLAHVIANTTQSHFATLSAVLSGVKELRYEIEQAKERLKYHNKKTILFVDEVHRWNKSQQDALLPWVENGTLTLIGATTENPFFEVNAALVSRSRIFRLFSLTNEQLKKIVYQAINDKIRGYGNYIIEFEKGALEHLVDVSNGDARILLNALQLAVETSLVNYSSQPNIPITISLASAEQSIQKKALIYDKGGSYHYDVISAFIKSIRGSDPDAALYYLALMLVSGEDPSFIFRRLLISATEDVGLADPNAINVVASNAAAFERIGLPEGRYMLSHATLYLATAPKSNSTTAIFKAIEIVENLNSGTIPVHLRDSSRDKGAFGDGKEYLYPHSFKGNWVLQQYLPQEFNDEVFYSPGESGYEKELKEKVLRRRSLQHFYNKFEIEQNFSVLILNGKDESFIKQIKNKKLFFDKPLTAQKYDLVIGYNCLNTLDELNSYLKSNIKTLAFSQLLIGESSLLSNYVNNKELFLEAEHKNAKLSDKEIISIFGKTNYSLYVDTYTTTAPINRNHVKHYEAFVNKDLLDNIVEQLALKGVKWRQRYLLLVAKEAIDKST